MDSKDDGKSTDTAGNSICTSIPESKGDENTHVSKDDANISCISAVRDSSEIESRRSSTSIEDEEEGKRIKRRKDKDDHVRKDDHSGRKDEHGIKNKNTLGNASNPKLNAVGVTAVSTNAVSATTTTTTAATAATLASISATVTTTSETSDNEDAFKCIGSPGPKVPPLKIVIPPVESDQSNRNGKTATRHHGGLPYVVVSNDEAGSTSSLSPSSPTTNQNSLVKNEESASSVTSLSNEEQRIQQRVLRSTLSNRISANNSGNNTNNNSDNNKDKDDDDDDDDDGNHPNSADNNNILTNNRNNNNNNNNNNNSSNVNNDYNFNVNTGGNNNSIGSAISLIGSSSNLKDSITNSNIGASSSSNTESNVGNIAYNSSNNIANKNNNSNNNNTTTAGSNNSSNPTSSTSTATTTITNTTSINSTTSGSCSGTGASNSNLCCTAGGVAGSNTERSSSSNGSETSGNSSPTTLEMSPSRYLSTNNPNSGTFNKEDGSNVAKSKTDCNNSAKGGSKTETSNVAAFKMKTESSSKTKNDTEDDNSKNSNSGEARGATAADTHNKDATVPVVELHPRKRKLKSKQEINHATAEADHSITFGSAPHPHEVPVTNCYQMFMDIRRQIDVKRKGLFPIQPKPPQGFKDYLMNRCTYTLAGNSIPRLKRRNAEPPEGIDERLKDLFQDQEAERYSLRMQHVVEKEKLVLSVEQEILRVHGRAARALANQALPFSACTILKDEEVYNVITPEQEEKDRNARSRYNGRLFISWLQDVDDKWEKIKEEMLARHHKEAESLNAVQKFNWDLKMRQLGLWKKQKTAPIDDSYVPMISVSDDFDLLPE